MDTITLPPIGPEPAVEVNGALYIEFSEVMALCRSIREEPAIQFRDRVERLHHRRMPQCEFGCLVHQDRAR